MLKSNFPLRKVQLAKKGLIQIIVPERSRKNYKQSNIYGTAK